MIALFIYLLKWGVTLTLLYSLYRLFLSRETFHALNRCVLLTIMLASMLLPLCPFEIGRTTMVQKGVEHSEAVLASALEKAMEPHHAAASGMDAKPLGRQGDKETAVAAWTGATTTGIVIRLAVWVYVVGLAACWLRYLLALMMTLRIIGSGRTVDVPGVPQGVRVLEHPSAEMPFSWMRWIVLPSKDMGENLRPILVHELGHVRYGHSWDMLLCELTTRMLWFLPFAWMLRRDLADVHEYEADRCVLEQGFEETKYQLLLIRKAARAGLQPVVNGFNRSSIKNRLKMMCRKKSSRTAALKVLYLLPLIAFAITAFARPTVVEELQRTLEREAERGSLLALPMAKPEPTKMAEQQTDDAEAAPDAEAAQAGDQGSGSQSATGDTLDWSLGVDTCFATPTPDPEALLDSTMTAVGARKIGQGIYVGAFRPNYTGDTIRVKHVQIDGGESWQIDGREDGYTVWLQKEDREELGHGYHIRTMQPARQAATPHVNNAPVDPRWRPADVTAQEANAQSMRLERGTDETRLNVYMTTEMPRATDGTLDMLAVDFDQLALVDPKTGDRYMCRRVENYDGKLVTLSIGDNAGVVVKMTGIYPPIPKKVRRVELAIATPRGWERTGTVFKLKQDGRSAQVIH